MLAKPALLAVALLFSFQDPLALAHQSGSRGGRGGDGGRGGERDGRNDGGGNRGGNRNGGYGSGSGGNREDRGNGGGGNQGWNNQNINNNDDRNNQAVYDPRPNNTTRNLYNGLNDYYGDGQAAYLTKSAKAYRAAAATTRALGVIATAEGLDKIIQNDIKIGDGDTLISTGLKSLEAGEKLNELSNEALSQMQEPSSSAGLEREVMEDPEAQSLLASLAQATGHSGSEILDKILESKGDIDILAKHFPAITKRKLKIISTDVSEDEFSLAGTKFHSIKNRLNFKSLRDALAQKSGEGSGVKPAPVLLATAQPYLPYQSAYTGNLHSPLSATNQPSPALAAVVRARGPASAPEFPNLGENLPSFDLELSQADPQSEISLFEKVRRKYIEIAPLMVGRK